VTVTDTETEPGRRHRRRPGEGRQLLLEAARDVFSEHGYARASTRAIAERAGIAEALLFRNFGSKAALFGEVALGPFQDFIDEWKELHPGKDEVRSEREITVDLISRAYDLFSKNRGLIITYIATSVFEPEVTRLESSPMFIEAINALARWAQTEFLEARGLAPVNVLITNRAFIGMVMSMALFDAWLLPTDGGHPTRDEIISELTDFVLYGVARPDDSKRTPAARTG
jgi:AcrR family transcriptional regulator